jgi:biotin carboxyl carrier protein
VSPATFELVLDGGLREISVEARDGTVVIREGERVLETEVRRISANELRFRIGERSVAVFMVRDGERMFVAVGGRQYIVSESSARAVRPGEGDEKAPGGPLRIRAPMPGKVTKVAVAEGGEVHKNQTLVIVEAMKMENEIKTSIDGVVTKVHVTAGDLVDAEKILVEIERKSG